MIKAIISKENEKVTIEAEGNVGELLNDTAILVNAVYTQLKNADPVSALMFRQGLKGMVDDPGSPLWQAMDGQVGIIFPK